MHLSRKKSVKCKKKKDVIYLRKSFPQVLSIEVVDLVVNGLSASNAQFIYCPNMELSS